METNTQLEKRDEGGLQDSAKLKQAQNKIYYEKKAERTKGVCCVCRHSDMRDPSLIRCISP